jgi:hypothetical protein
MGGTDKERHRGAYRLGAYKSIPRKLKPTMSFKKSMYKRHPTPRFSMNCQAPSLQQK